MSRGMYTKNQMADGTVFYFNASLNKSVWKPPADAIIHEAVKLKTLQQDETSSSSSSSSASSGQQQASASTTGTTNAEILPAGWMKLFDQTSGRPYYVNQYLNITQWETPNVVPTPVPAPAPVPVPASAPINVPVPINASVITDQNATSTGDSDVHPFGVPDNVMADRIAQAALNKQKSATSSKQSRFKKTDTTGNEEEESSEFRKMFNAAHKNQGLKDATTGACNVR